MEINGNRLTEDSALAIIRQFQDQRARLTMEQAVTKLNSHRRTILRGFKYDLTDDEQYELHARLIKGIADSYMLREYSEFIVDEHNKNVLRFLTYYFNGCKLAETIFPTERYKIHKNILLIGEPGTGKTLLMQVFADYLRMTGNDNAFVNISATQLMNYYKLNGHIDKYTYNEAGAKESFDGSPVNVCLNDLGLMTEKAKSFGTELTKVTDEFLFARYEIFQQMGRRYHITSNLTVRELKTRFEGRLVDRFKSFNVIELRGGSRRV